MAIRPDQTAAMACTVQRAWQRYRLALTPTDYGALCQAARSQGSMLLHRQPDGREVRLVGFRGRAVVAVVDGAVVITVLAPDRSLPTAFRIRRAA